MTMRSTDGMSENSRVKIAGDKNIPGSSQEDITDPTTSKDASNHTTTTHPTHPPPLPINPRSPSILHPHPLPIRTPPPRNRTTTSKMLLRNTHNPNTLLNLLPTFLRLDLSAKISQTRKQTPPPPVSLLTFLPSRTTLIKRACRRYDVLVNGRLRGLLALVGVDGVEGLFCGVRPAQTWYLSVGWTGFGL